MVTVAFHGGFDNDPARLRHNINTDNTHFLLMISPGSI
jgi:hypothetical protein